MQPELGHDVPDLPQKNPDRPFLVVSRNADVDHVISLKVFPGSHRTVIILQARPIPCTIVLLSNTDLFEGGS